MTEIILDAELAPMIVADFSLRRRYPLGPDNILQDFYLISVCWKKLGERTVHSVDLLDDMERFEKDPTDDYHVVKTIHDLLMDETEVVIGHNVGNFDLKKLNTRFLYHGLPPVPKSRVSDTLSIARKEFAFSSNKLDYIAKFLNVGKKIETRKGLWLECLRGVKKAVKDMTRYCKGDIRINEKVYLLLRPYSTVHPNLSTVGDFDRASMACPKCKSENLQKRGYSRTNAGVFQRYQCQDCSGWSRGRRNLASKKNTGVSPTDKYLTSQ